jgi:hypothetical protein
MASSASPASASGPEGIPIGRRWYRGIAFALLIGFAGAALSAVPSLFVQSVFVMEMERCSELQRQDVATYGEVRTDCGEVLADAPVWLPLVVLAGGAAVGAAGGFGYGFISPRSPSRQRQDERPWLPF